MMEKDKKMYFVLLGIEVSGNIMSVCPSVFKNRILEEQHLVIKHSEKEKKSEK